MIAVYAVLAVVAITLSVLAGGDGAQVQSIILFLSGLGFLFSLMLRLMEPPIA